MINKECCNKQMISLGNIPTADRTIQENNVWICGECGSIYEEKTSAYDDEDLWAFIENHEQELKDTKIFKELKKDFA